MLCTYNRCMMEQDVIVCVYCIYLFIYGPEAQCLYKYTCNSSRFVLFFFGGRDWENGRFPSPVVFGLIPDSVTRTFLE